MVLLIASEPDHKPSQVRWSKLGVSLQGSELRSLDCSQLLLRCDLSVGPRWMSGGEREKGMRLSSAWMGLIGEEVGCAERESEGVVVPQKNVILI